MKKRILLVVLGILVGAAAIVAIYRFCFRKSIPDAPLSEQVVSILKQNDCYVCHASAPNLPFYASLPVIGPTIKAHATRAFLFTDLETKTADINNVDEVTLSMIDHAVSYGTMPIAQYKMVHWGTGFNKKEKSILAEWVRNSRAALYESHACKELANEPVRPMLWEIPYDKDKANLGERMYNDGRLSLDGTISCASCHILKDGGVSDPQYRTSEGINGQFGGINAPTVYNSYFNIQQFWNGRAADLQQQAAGPPVNPVEMGDQTWDDIVARLRRDKALVKEFETLYPGVGLTEATVTDAIAEFEKTLITPGARFDLYLRGNADAISKDELEGYETFKRLGCATCHTGIILGGQSFEKVSIYGDYYADRSSDIEYNADDDGLKGFTLNEDDLHRFKVPTLRNIALTAPYFHDGSYPTMEEAVKAMAKYQLGKNLSDKEVISIVSFMRTLTGENPYLTAK